MHDGDVMTPGRHFRQNAPARYLTDCRLLARCFMSASGARQIMWCHFSYFCCRRYDARFYYASMLRASALYGVVISDDASKSQSDGAPRRRLAAQVRQMTFINPLRAHFTP